MILRTFALAALRAAAVLAVCTKLQDCPQFESLKTSDCQPFHHFLARGSTSPYPGHVIETVGKVCAALNSEGSPNACGYEDITYWAMNGGDRWCKSAHEGALNGAAQMRNYTQRCPDSHLILMGFSQGGSVALDVLGGGGGELWGCNQADNPKMDRTTAPGSKSTHSCPTSRLLHADPRQLPQLLLSGPPAAVQTSRTRSVAARSATAALLARLRSSPV
jgi:acetylxylan esterase